jgi:hypothetical protein
LTCGGKNIYVAKKCKEQHGDTKYEQQLFTIAGKHAKLASQLSA